MKVTDNESSQGISGALALLVAAGALLVGLFSGLVLGLAGGYVIAQQTSDEPAAVEAQAVAQGTTDEGAAKASPFEKGDSGTEDQDDEGEDVLPFGITPPEGMDQLPFFHGPGMAIAGEEAPFLGVVVSTVGEGEEPPPTDAESGAYIEKVEPGSAADEAGLQEGEVILSFDGEKIESKDDLAEAVSNAEVGDEIELEVFRDGKTASVTATLGSRPMVVPITPENLDEMLKQMPPELRDQFRDLFKVPEEQPEA
jgi:membrane-associated protease RseP (regulator of RpoE activity)